MAGLLCKSRCAVVSAALSRCFTGSESGWNGLNAAGVPRVTTSSLFLPVKPISDNQTGLYSHKVATKLLDIQSNNFSGLQSGCLLC